MDLETMGNLGSLLLGRYQSRLRRQSLTNEFGGTQTFELYMIRIMRARGNGRGCFAEVLVHGERDASSLS